MILAVKTRQKYLKELGFYNGKIDGVWGPLSKKATLALQKKYFKRSKDIDGFYGNDTDILLRNAILVKRNCRYFKLEEFRCECNSKCTGYPKVLNKKLLIILDDLRKYFETPITITCGERCKPYNDSLVGSIPNSQHLYGKAADIYIPGIPLVNIKKKAYDLSAAYCYYGTPNMGNAVHINV